MTGDIADYIIDTFDEFYEYGGTLSCRYCGECGLHWDQLDNGAWRLHDGRCVLHNCRKYPLRDCDEQR